MATEKTPKIVNDDELDGVVGGIGDAGSTSAFASSTCPKCHKVIPGEKWIEHINHCMGGMKFPDRPQ